MSMHHGINVPSSVNNEIMEPQEYLVECLFKVSRGHYLTLLLEYHTNRGRLTYT